MSFIGTLSAFYFGTVITNNPYLNFDEGGPELTATIPVNDYTLTEIAEAVATAMNLAGGQVYSVTVNRTTRKLTISAPGNFALLCNTGSQSGTGPWTVLGFDIATDKTGSNSYEGESGAGSEYLTQIGLGQYTQLEDYEVKESAVVNVTTNGVVETIQYGDGQRMRCNVRGVSDFIGTKNYNYYENATGVQDLRDFMNYLITKGKLEFMPDVGDRTTFHDLLLETTEASNQGTQFTIKNMSGANKYFETGKLLFRKVIE